MADRTAELVLPTLTPDPAEICPPCGRCCRYVAVGIDAPTSVRSVSMLLWMLYHRSLSAYQAHDGEWFLLVAAACEHLRADGLCGIYENRPLICRDYHVEECEGTSAEPAEKVRFDGAGAFLAWLKATKPALHARCAKAGVLPEL